MEKTKQNSSGSRAEPVLYGILLITVSLIGILNSGVVGSFLTFISAFAFGILYILLFGYLFFMGIFLIVKKEILKVKLSFQFWGIVLILFGLCIASSYDANMTISTFFSSYLDHVESAKSGILSFASASSVFSNLGGGFIGYFLAGAFNTLIGYIGTMILVVVFTLSGLIMVFKDLIISLIHFISEHSSGKNFKPLTIEKNEEKLPEEQEESFTPVTEVKTKPSQTVETFSFDDIHKKDENSEVKISQNQEETREESKPVAINNNIQVSVFNKNPEKPSSVIEEDEETLTEEKAEEVPVKEIKKTEETKEEEKQVVQPTPIVFQPEIKVVVPESKTVTKPLSQPKKENRTYIYPSISLLEDHTNVDESAKKNALAIERMNMINKTFEDFKIGAQVVSYTIGPSVTRFDVKVDSNVKTSLITTIEEDLAVRLGGNKTVRIVTIVEGKTTSGIEVGNEIVDTVSFKECLKTIAGDTKHKLLFPLGKDISGEVVSCSLDEMPHLLVCGTTGSGKSVFIHNIICSLIMRNHPDELKLMLIDPKRIEFTKYQNLPHLLCPVITSTEQGKVALMKLVEEMERRYDLFADKGRGCSNYKEYMEICSRYGYEKIPYIVMICDEFADFMTEGDKEVSKSIQRIAQKARACGIHIVIATQRPSAKVITGEIKANIPSRVALSVSSHLESRIILDEPGAENLLGRGDLLARIPNYKNTVRVQSAYISNLEIQELCEFIKSQWDFVCDPNFEDLDPKVPSDTFVTPDQGSKVMMRDYHNDEKYEEIKKFVIATGKCSTTKLQNVFGIGFSRADGILDTLESDGVIVREGNKRVLSEEYSTTGEDD